jgi:hypothetical protein
MSLGRGFRIVGVLHDLGASRDAKLVSDHMYLYT